MPSTMNQESQISSLEEQKKFFKNHFTEMVNMIKTIDRDNKETKQDVKLILNDIKNLKIRVDKIIQSQEETNAEVANLAAKKSRKSTKKSKTKKDDSEESNEEKKEDEIKPKKKRVDVYFREQFKQNENFLYEYGIIKTKKELKSLISEYNKENDNDNNPSKIATYLYKKLDKDQKQLIKDVQNGKLKPKKTINKSPKKEEN